MSLDPALALILDLYQQLVAAEARIRALEAETKADKK
jgi:hypothetical protein